MIPPFKRSRHTREFAKLTHHSLLIVEIDHSVIEETQQAAVSRVSFVPKLKICKVGRKAQFASSLLRDSYSTISRHLAVVNIISEEDKTAIHDVISSNNLACIRQMLSARTLTPFDHFSDGSSLLSVC